MASKSNRKTRRTDVRRLAPLGRVYPWRRLDRRRVVVGLMLTVGFMAAAGLTVAYARSQPKYRVGQVVDRTVYGRVEVQWQDPKLTELKRQIKREETPTVYTLNTAFFDTFRQRLIVMPGIAAQAKTVEEVAGDLRQVFNLAHNRQALEALKQYQQDGQPTEQWLAMVDQFLANIRVNKVVLSNEDYQLEIAGRAWNVTLKPPDGEAYTVGKSRLINVNNNSALDQWITAEAYRFPTAIQPILVAYLINSRTPTYLKDQEATERAKEEAAKQVPLEMVTYKPGDKPLVTAGTVLDKADFELLQTERRLYRASLKPWQRVLAEAGPQSLVVLVTVGLVGTVLALKRRVAENPWRGLALGLLLLGCLGLAVAVRAAGGQVEQAAAVGSTLLAAVIIAIAYERLFAVVVSVLLSILVALALDLRMGQLVVTMTGCVVGVAQLRELRHRGKLIRAGVLTGLVVAVATCGAGLAERSVYPGMYAGLAGESVWGFIASLAVGFFVLGVLPFVERVFRVTTAMTLLELSDVNQPLLRRLAQAAPGTYNHSLTVATIAEAAADAIGADGLLVRVGAYYHDIGKMNKPQYFVENQGGGPNRHEKLSPAMSLLIIVGHVKDGMELAREFRLPPVLHHFIESHHGTTLVEYFYHTARQRTAEDPDAAQPSEFEFRYPGPKPQTREAAILMLSDSVEAGCRTMNEPTAGRIEQFVHHLAMKRLMDGQFSECGLTLAELEQVEAALVKGLCGIYHGRIAYPSDESAPTSKGEPAKTGPGKSRSQPGRAGPAAG